MIGLNEFSQSVGRLEKMFNKQLSEDQLAMYHDELGYWDKETLHRAISALVKIRKPIPSQFPTIQELDSVCMEETSGERAEAGQRRGVSICHSCYSTGYLEVKCERSGQRWIEMWRCGHCEIWADEAWDRPKKTAGYGRVGAMPMMTVQEFDDWYQQQYFDKGINARLIRFQAYDKLVAETGGNADPVHRKRDLQPHLDGIGEGV